MRRRRMVRTWCWIVIGAFAVCPVAFGRDMVNLVKNPGFDSGFPEPWYVYHRGDYKLVQDSKEARSGQFFATFAWRTHPKGGYCALCTPKMKVYPGVTYELGLWAKGRGGVNLWVIQTSKSGKFMGTDFGEKTWNPTGAWQHFKRTWKAPEGIAGAHLFVRIEEGTVASLDDVSFSYDRDKFTPPEAETIEVRPQVKASNADLKLYLNNKLFDGSKKALYGECVLAIEARATGADPRLSGAIRFGEHEVKLDKRWRAAPLPQGDAWRKVGFDDREWKPVSVAGDGAWDAGGAKAIALRRVVLWKSSRKDPWQENQWLVMMRDAMYVAEGSAGAFVFNVREPSKTPSKQLTMHIEAPAFLKLLDRDEQASHGLSNYRHKDMRTRTVERDGVNYIHYEFTYGIPDRSSYASTYYKPSAPLYFQAAEKTAKDKKYTFTFWREANGNITDVPMALPLTVTGPVNGRQGYFHLTYSRPAVVHSGGFATYSIAERYALSDTLIDAGMNVAWVNSLRQERGVLDYYRSLKNRGVKLQWGFNYGMNWPGGGTKLLKEHPEFQAKFYEGSKDAFESKLGHRWHDMTGKEMWCQEYAAAGGKVFYDNLRPRIEEAKEKLGDILYTMWDWEYETFAWSCFCDRCKRAFRNYAGIPEGVELTDEVIVTKYPQKWIEFRLDQSARHQLAMMAFCKEYGVMLTNWHPGECVENPDFNYSLLGDSYEYHFMGWPGNELPLMGEGRRGEPGIAWKKLNPNIHLAGQTMDAFASAVIDERMFKIWTLNMALGTHGGGWVIYLAAMSPFNQTHGRSYFMGEATRLIHEFEEFFKTSKHIEAKFQQIGLKGRANELIALESRDGKEALALLFNQGDAPAKVTVTVKDAAAGWTKVQQWEGAAFDNAAVVTVTVPAKDVVALHYK